MTGGARGFTLIELLVAASLTALIAVLATGGLRFGLAAWERTGALAEASVESRAVEAFLRRQIGAARPIRLRDGTREPPVLFEGRPDGLILAAPLAARLARPGLALVAIEARTGGAGLDLALVWTAIGEERPPARPGPDAAIEPLATGLADVRFRYLGPEGWRADWRARSGLPAAVELTLDRPDAPGLPLVVALPGAGT